MPKKPPQEPPHSNFGVDLPEAGAEHLPYMTPANPQDVEGQIGPGPGGEIIHWPGETRDPIDSFEWGDPPDMPYDPNRPFSPSENPVRPEQSFESFEGVPPTDISEHPDYSDMGFKETGYRTDATESPRGNPISYKDTGEIHSAEWEMEQEAMKDVYDAQRQRYEERGFGEEYDLARTEEYMEWMGDVRGANDPTAEGELRSLDEARGVPYDEPMSSGKAEIPAAGPDAPGPTLFEQDRAKGMGEPAGAGPNPEEADFSFPEGLGAGSKIGPGILSFGALYELTHPDEVAEKQAEVQQSWEETEAAIQEALTGTDPGEIQNPGGEYFPGNEDYSAYEPEYVAQPDYPERSYDQPNYVDPSENQPWQEPSYDQPSYGDQPYYEQPSYGDQPNYDQPYYEQPNYEQPYYQEPSYDQPSYDQPYYDQPSYNQPSYNEPQYEAPEPQYDPAYGPSNPSMPTYGAPTDWTGTFSGGSGGNDPAGFGPGGCFASGTQVLTPSLDTKSIDKIKPGEAVVAYDEVKKQLCFAVVKAVLHHRNHQTWWLSVEGYPEVITTLDHRFYVSGEWKTIKQMEPGDKITTYDFVSRKVIESEMQAAGEYAVQDVWNLSLDSTYTYFAGGLLAHNMKFQQGGDEVPDDFFD
jgi:hypothetical protein